MVFKGIAPQNTKVRNRDYSNADLNKFTRVAYETALAHQKLIANFHTKVAK